MGRAKVGVAPAGPSLRQLFRKPCRPYKMMHPIRLSEQEGVDCDSRSYGCSGGCMHNYWKMSKEIGSQTNEDYEYEAQDGGCRNQNNKVIASKMLNYGYAQGTEFWVVQNSWGSWWGDRGYVYLAVETGPGVTGMNMYVQHMSTDPDFPQDEDDSSGDDSSPNPVPNCDHNEGNNAWGPHTCWDDSECAGMRECSAWGWCHGRSYCDEPLPDMCQIDESQNSRGPNRCWNSVECHGDRTCSTWGWCQGSSNC